MMIETRGNIMEVAKPYLKLDLQLFSEELPPDDGGSFSDTDTSPESIEESSQAQEHETVEDTVSPDIADQVDDKTVQDDKTNSAFADMRRKMETLEKQNTIARKYGQYGVFDEADVSRVYGHQGIHNLSQLDQAIENQRKEAEREQWLEKGVDPDEIQQLIDDKLNNHPSVVAAREAEFNNSLMQGYQELVSEYADIVKSPDDISPEVWAKFNNGKSGLTLAESFTLINRKEIATKQQAAIKQAALNNMNSKNHLRPNGADGSSAADLTQIDPNVLATYKKLVPGKTDQFYIDHYKKSQK